MSPHNLPAARQRRKPTAAQFVLLASFFAVCAVGLVSSRPQLAQDSPAEERKFESTIPAHVPLKVKVKNERAFKDMKNKCWARDLEIEVKNTGDKPIYFMYMLIVLPEVLVGGYPLAFQVDYGRTELVHLAAPLQPDDVPIKPGESVTLKLHESEVKGYEETRDKEHLPNPAHVKLDMQLINFGDYRSTRHRRQTFPRPGQAALVKPAMWAKRS